VGAPPARLGTVRLPLSSDPDRRPRQRVDFGASGKPAVTEWAVERSTPHASRLVLRPETGRRHQLRMHCLALGCPIAGDGLYSPPGSGGQGRGNEGGGGSGGGTAHAEAQEAGPARHRLHLHAAELGFTHPVSGEPLHFRSSPPFRLESAGAEASGSDAPGLESAGAEASGSDAPGDEGERAVPRPEAPQAVLTCRESTVNSVAVEVSLGLGAARGGGGGGGGGGGETCGADASKSCGSSEGAAGGTEDAAAATFHAVLFSSCGQPIDGHELAPAAGRQLCRFHFLPPDSELELQVWRLPAQDAAQSEDAACARARAACRLLASAQLRTEALPPDLASHGMQPELYVGDAHLPLGPWVMTHPGNWLWAAAPACWRPAFVCELFRYGLFPLPHSDSLVPIINPEERYCIDLRAGREGGRGEAGGAGSPVRWDKSKRVRRHGRDFVMSVNRSFESSLRRLQDYHLAKGSGSTWLTERLRTLLVGLQGEPWGGCGEQSSGDGGGGGGGGDGGRVDLCMFELWEQTAGESEADCGGGGGGGGGSSGGGPHDGTSERSSEQERHRTSAGGGAGRSLRLVAVVAGFGVGRVWHDFSMATLVRDRRSPGSLLTKAVGHLLAACGYDLWYWGCKIGYMAEYDDYGGRDLGREEFWRRWGAAREQPPPGAGKGVRDVLRTGGGLVPALLE